MARVRFQGLVPPGYWLGPRVQLMQSGLRSRAGIAGRKTNERANKQAMFEYEATTETELQLKPGDVVTVLKEDTSGWWQGEMEGRIGWFPYNFVEILPSR
mmetsp:Transcript_42548/g.66658  ORF Transcript_42548/g.66658 Transcript_42548/m.66658 type:complete len:100 (+) Transcript_42548:1177-1476(+)